MTRKIQKMVKYQVSKVWQEGVDNEGGEECGDEGKSGDDKEDTKDEEELNI
jgi:hypothetical protein